jgi:hypothetical protein
MDELYRRLWGSLQSIYAALVLLTPIIGAIAVYYARRAAHVAERNNAAIETMWLLLKNIRYRQDKPGPPPTAEPDSLPGQPPKSKDRPGHAE